MKIKKQLVILLTCLSLLLIPIHPAAAETLPQDHKSTYTTSFTGTDSSLTGSSAQQQYFEVLDYWNVDQVKIKLHFQISQITEEQISSVTLTLNGVLVLYVSSVTTRQRRTAVDPCGAQGVSEKRDEYAGHSGLFEDRSSR